MSTKTVSAEAFNDQCNWLRSCVASITGCLTNEIPNEARILRSTIADTEAMKLGRRNPLLEERRTNLVTHAREVLARRVERALSANIFESLAAAETEAK